MWYQSCGFVLLYILLGTILIAWEEVIYDRKISSVIGNKDRNKSEHDLIHSDQIPLRATALGFLVLSVPHQWDYSYLIIPFIVGFLYWIIFDIMVNLIWLKKPIFYLSQNVYTDRLLSPKMNWIVKFLGLFISTFFWIYLNF